MSEWEQNLFPPPRSELWPSLRWCTGTAGQHGGSGDSSSCLQSAVMPDGVLIDYLAVSHPFITSSPCWTPEVNGRGLCVSEPPPPTLPPLPLVTAALDVWFMNGGRRRHRQQEQIVGWRRRLNEAICDLSLPINLHGQSAHRPQRSSVRRTVVPTWISCYWFTF